MHGGNRHQLSVVCWVVQTKCCGTQLTSWRTVGQALCYVQGPQNEKDMVAALGVLHGVFCNIPTLHPLKTGLRDECTACPPPPHGLPGRAFLGALSSWAPMAWTVPPSPACSQSSCLEYLQGGRTHHLETWLCRGLSS